MGRCLCQFVVMYVPEPGETYNGVLIMVFEYGTALARGHLGEGWISIDPQTWVFVEMVNRGRINVQELMYERN